MCNANVAVSTPVFEHCSADINAGELNALNGAQVNVVVVCVPMNTTPPVDSCTAAVNARSHHRHRHHHHHHKTDMPYTYTVPYRTVPYTYV